MNRKEFLFKAGVGAAVICSGCLWGCSEDNPTGSDQAPQNVDFTLDLNASENAPLNNIGGSIYKDGILIAKINSTTFTALSQRCTHQGSTVQLELNNNRVHCPNHGSNFNFDGAVLNGPAASPLRKYNTSLNGTMLRVFS